MDELDILFQRVVTLKCQILDLPTLNCQKYGLGVKALFGFDLKVLSIFVLKICIAVASVRVTFIWEFQRCIKRIGYLTFPERVFQILKCWAVL